MVNKNRTKPAVEKQRPDRFLPHVLVSIFVGIVFVLALGVSLLIPSMMLIYFVGWLELSGIGFDLGWIMGLWVLSTLVSVAGYFLIQQTFIKKVLNRRVVSKLPAPRRDE